MALVVTAVENQFEPIENGYYNARLVNIIQKELKFGPVFEFEFEILQDEYKERTVRGICSAVYSPGNKLANWIYALGGPTLEIGEEFDVESLKNAGASARILVENSQGKSKDGRDVLYSNVTNVTKPVKKAVAPVAKPVATKPAPVTAQAPAPRPVAKAAPAPAPVVEEQEEAPGDAAPVAVAAGGEVTDDELPF